MCVLAWLTASSASTGSAKDVNLPELAGKLAAHEETFWKQCDRPVPAETVTSRDLFAYALVLAEADEHPERLDRLFALAEKMQDRDPKSKGYGNFWWAWRDGKVTDANAVDFSMRGGALLWLKHQDFVPAPERSRLRALLELAVQGCLRHKVPESYSNIAIMNAGDLILLGETLGRPEVAAEGYARLDRVFRYTQANGIHEYNSPTYTGVDLDGLGIIEAYCQRDSGRVEARALLKLFWSDVALNWFPPAQKLAGTQSRTYDYVRGLGGLDQNLILAGILAEPLPMNIDMIFSAQAKWSPGDDIRKLSDQFPRVVRESWGDKWWQSRTHYVLPDVTLSSSAAAYGGRMDMPMTLDLPGDRGSVRGYFIADGRNDPYGKIPLPAGPHKKAFHLDPFWTAAQRGGDALGLAVYRQQDIPDIATTLVSNFVLPLDVDGIWVGDQRVQFEKDNASSVPVKPGETVVLRKGEAVVGLRVPWSRGLDGNAAPVFLVNDGNVFGAMRVAVEHVATGAKPAFSGVNAGAAFWVRVGDGIKTEEDFTVWRKQFAAATATMEIGVDKIRLQAAGADGPLSVSAKAPWNEPTKLEPTPSRVVMELNGKDVGSELLGSR